MMTNLQCIKNYTYNKNKQKKQVNSYFFACWYFFFSDITSPSIQVESCVSNKIDFECNDFSDLHGHRKP